MAAPPWTSAFAAADRWAAFWQLWLERAAGDRAIEAARTTRLHDLVAYARRRSPLYAELYRGVPHAFDALSELPVTSRRALMARFDDWATDRDVTRERADRFLSDRSRVGERFLDRYVVWKSSGTSGEPGIYVQDARSLSTYDAMLAVQLVDPALAACCVAGSARGGRAALIAATGDHFASIASWQRAGRWSVRSSARAFSVMEPLDSLVASLDAFDPAYVASYPTVLALLAGERRAGRSSMRPSLLWSGGECLAPGLHDELERTFGCPVMNEYGASECLSIGFGCPEKWIHVNADWVIVEPVDRDLRPTAPGATSHTVLVTNLANRVQPLIRYDLGDAVTLLDGRCRCGNAFPALRVEGRRDEVVVLTERGRVARIAPMALTTVLEESSGVHRFQIGQRDERTLLLRLDVASPKDRRAAFGAGARALGGVLATQGVPHTAILLDASAPVVDARSGKLRQVVVEPID
jgi:phenylacetate-coenzyme A ligase PaaK-like adenylate-forming protein